MPYTPKGIAQIEELVKALNGLVWPPDAEVVKWKYQIGEDWNGYPSVDFSFVLRDQATTSERLGEVTDRIRSLIADKIDPRGQWDLIPYFRFISQSENEQLKRGAI